MTKAKIIVTTAMVALLAGCTKDSDIACDSKVTKQRIVKDFTEHLRSKLPESLMKHVAGITLEEIVTLEADDVAKTRVCEANVKVSTPEKDYHAYQGIKYANQTVSGGESSTRTQYHYADTFNYIAGNTRLAVDGLILKYEADAAGFASPDKYRQYRDAKETVRAGRQAIENSAAELEGYQTRKQQLKPAMEAARADLQNSKAVMAPNQYVEMSSLTLSKANKVKNGTFKLDAITFKAQVKNITSEVLKAVGFEANIYLENSDKPFIAQAVTRSTSLNGIAPGESREVTFTVMGVMDAKDAQLMRSGAWQKADNFSVLVLPSAYTDAQGQRYSVTGRYVPKGTGRFGRIPTNIKTGEQILWSWYEGLDSSVRDQITRMETTKQDVAAAEALIKELERTKASL
jgi:hypothetical protein